MCDRCILNGSKYICNSCYNELVEYKDTWTPPLTKRQIREKIESFMETEPETYRLKDVDIDEEFKNLTGRTDDL